MFAMLLIPLIIAVLVTLMVWVGMTPPPPRYPQVEDRHRRDRDYDMKRDRR
jgi:hypothetical protein